jgi:hypothetical protein
MDGTLTALMTGVALNVPATDEFPARPASSQRGG